MLSSGTLLVPRNGPLRILRVMTALDDEPVLSSRSAASARLEAELVRRVHTIGPVIAGGIAAWTADPDNQALVAKLGRAGVRLEDEVAIVQLKAGVYYGLDPVGARIWELIATPRSLRTVRDVVLAEYEVDAERCESALLRLVHTMMEAGLVEISDGAPR